MRSLSFAVLHTLFGELDVITLVTPEGKATAQAPYPFHAGFLANVDEIACEAPARCCLRIDLKGVDWYCPGCSARLARIKGATNSRGGAHAQDEKEHTETREASRKRGWLGGRVSAQGCPSRLQNISMIPRVKSVCYRLEAHATSLRGIPCNPMETPGMKRQSRFNASNSLS
jgi:hypothetical protein